jgi:hypothetical protein
MIIANIYKVPDKCPADYRYIDELPYQGSICHRCPVFTCAVDKAAFCLVEPDEYRADWAEEWAKFFKTGEEPILYLKYQR